MNDKKLRIYRGGYIGESAPIANEQPLLPAEVRKKHRRKYLDEEAIEEAEKELARQEHERKCKEQEILLPPGICNDCD